MCRPNSFIWIILLLMVSTGCVNSTKVGLSNAPGRGWRHDRTDGGRDQIANGDDSCERAGSVRPDPAPVRLIPCPNNEPFKARKVAAQ